MVAVLVLGAVAALATMRMTSSVHGQAGPGTVEVSAGWARQGSTEVALPPLGRIVATTHAAPVNLRIRLEELDIDGVQQALSTADPEEALVGEVVGDLPALLRRFVLRALAASALVGAVAGALVPRRRWRNGIVGAVGGLLAVGAVLSWTWRGYDSSAFEEARFEGSLERAPGVLAAAGRQVQGLEEVRGLVSALSGQVAALYAATEAGAVNGETLILHVSDIHSNPLGLELALQLATSFDVDAVLDTGDLTSFGLPVEAQVSDIIADFDVPYLLVPGNHDSAAIRTALAASGVVTVLDGEVSEVGPVRILGIGDPTYTADNRLTTAEANEIKRRRAPSVAAAVRRNDPDVLAVHDPNQARAAVGSVPVVVAGHGHQRSSEHRDGTLVLTVGSTGATGLGSFTVETSSSYQAQVLHFDGSRLVAVDYVTVRGVTGDFEVERQVIEESTTNR